MLGTKYQKQEISCHSLQGALAIANVLVQEDYVVMISREENLFVLNFEYSPKGRNGTVFMNIEEFDENTEELIEHIKSDSIQELTYESNHII